MGNTEQVTDVLVIGAGVAGLGTALALGRDGHRVTVLERDSEGPPASAHEAWDHWQRKGVNQFHMLHFFLPRFRAIDGVELIGKVVSVLRRYP